MKYGIFIIAIFLCKNCLAEDLKAITTDGKSVILHDNGKWEFDKSEKEVTGFSFRKTNWGMSKKEVKKTESGEILKDDNILGYQTRVAGLDTIIAYIFVEDKLVRARYVFVEKHSNKNDFLTDYSKVFDILNKKYGKPTDEKTYWKNDLYKDDYQDWGMALSVGHLAKYASWEDEVTKVFLSISGDNHKASHFVEYVSKDLETLEKAKSEENTAEQF